MTLARTKPAIYYRVSGIVMKPVRLLLLCDFLLKVLLNLTVHNVCSPIILNLLNNRNEKSHRIEVFAINGLP